VTPQRKTARRWRAIQITPLGLRILREIELGTYQFDTRSARMKRENARRRAARANP
jgi:hypothetical protein